MNQVNLTDEQVVKNDSNLFNKDEQVVKNDSNLFNKDEQDKHLIQKKILTKNWKRQIRSEQIRFIIVNFISWIIFIGLFVLSLMWILNETSLIAFNISNVFVLFRPWFIIPCLGVVFIIAVKNSLDWYRFQKEKNIHFANENYYDLERIPNFVIEIYKRSHGTLIFFRWLLVVSMILGGLYLTYATLANENKEYSFTFLSSEITINNQENHIKEIIITSCCLFALIIFNIWIWIIYDKAISNLLATFDIKKTYPDSELRSYQWKVNFWCFAFFLLPFFFVFLMFYLFRRFRNK